MYIRLQVLSSILTLVRKGSQTTFVDAVDLLTNRPSAELRKAGPYSLDLRFTAHR